jgi:SAM-dependent methyltransferase
MATASGLPPRSQERVYSHYLIEKDLADRLRNASREERRGLYTSVYDELLRRVEDHPLLNPIRDKSQPQPLLDYHLSTLTPFIKPDTVFLEIGAGTCQVSLSVAPKVKHVYAVDVSREITAGVVPPANFDLLISDGTNIPVPPGSVTVAFSNQLMEHLHPDDAAEQLREIYTALAPGGVYLCFTPNRITGPHDISRGFDEEATGLHLHEYTVRELRRILLEAGFRNAQLYIPSHHLLIPSAPVATLESALEHLPSRSRRSFGSQGVLRAMLGIRMVATK